MFNNLTNKQCAILLAILTGLFGPVILLVVLNIIEYLFGGLVTVTGVIFLGYVTYKVIRMIDPDNDPVEDELPW